MPLLSMRRLLCLKQRALHLRNQKTNWNDFIGKRLGHFADQSFYGVGLTSIFGTFSEQDIEKTRDILSFRTGNPKHAGGLWMLVAILSMNTMDIIDKDILVRDIQDICCSCVASIDQPDSSL